MKKKWITALGIVLLIGMLGGCFHTNKEEVKTAELPDGIYTAEFNTDSSMFRVNEVYDGKGTLTVEKGEMTIHISLGSKNIVNLYVGLAKDAKKEGAKLLSPTVDTITYPDGWVEEVYGYDIPVSALEEEFNLALIGKKEKWYDHKVVVSNPEPLQDKKKPIFEAEKLEEGKYTVALTLEGGSGKAKLLSPATLTVSEGMVTAMLQWSSPYYDYMIVEEKKYFPVNTEGNSTFEIPVQIFDEAISVIGNTVAMSTPHEIEYTLIFHSDTIKIVE